MKIGLYVIILILYSPYVFSADDDWTGINLVCEGKAVDELYQFLDEERFRRITVYYKRSQLDVVEGAYRPFEHGRFMEFIFDRNFISNKMEDGDISSGEEYQQKKNNKYFDRQEMVVRYLGIESSDISIRCKSVGLEDAEKAYHSMVEKQKRIFNNKKQELLNEKKKNKI